ncbi:heme-binding protein (plasmid) [Chimaeribacter arupi]|uniref:GlcG/HbpS family heme-binding protein n=1 Tax=Yersiniaceae TaxID=1903411 RepID=UPI0009340EBA|nr:MULTISPECIES: heme-binding protein [Yersiniaceae]PLR52817.1 heme-binding protein [Chimaeribacter arupi]WKZ94576.1 heme-binding protein [Chimaeribacter arupi]
MKRFMIAMMLAAAPGLALSAEPAAVYDMTQELSSKLATEALAVCHGMNRQGVVAVVDRGGNLVSLMRDDNVGPHNTQAAWRKAFTALSTKTPTKQFARQAQSSPDTVNLNTVNELLLLGGGVPVKYHGQVIGAVGLAGTGGAESDDHCGSEAIKRVLGESGQQK